MLGCLFGLYRRACEHLCVWDMCYYADNVSLLYHASGRVGSRRETEAG